MVGCCFRGVGFSLPCSAGCVYACAALFAFFVVWCVGVYFSVLFVVLCICCSLVWFDFDLVVGGYVVCFDLLWFGVV